MKIAIKIFFFLVFTSLSLLIAQKIKNIESENEEIIEKIRIMPDFESIIVSKISKNNIDEDTKATALNFFNTHCQFCQHEIKDIIEYQHLLENIQFLLLSDQPMDTLIKFSYSYGIDSMARINICQVNYLDFIEKFGELAPPTTFVYDSDKHLIKKYKGQIRATVIAEDIKKHYRTDEIQKESF